jgi:hypothetical protein
MKAARWTPRRRSFSSKAPTVAQSRWRTQPATVNKPKKSNLRRSKVRPQRKTGTDSPNERGQIGEQVTNTSSSREVTAGISLRIVASAPNNA